VGKPTNLSRGGDLNMETGGLSPSGDGVALDQAAHMEELSRMLREPSGQVG